MPEPISIVALSLTCLQGCVKALVLIGKAQGYEQNVADAQFRTTLVLHSLSSWASAAGLTQDPPTLLVNASDAHMVPQILKQLEALFVNVKDLRNRYGTHLQSTNEEIKLLEDGHSSISSPLSSRTRRWVERIDISVFLKRTQPWNRLRWVALDDEKYQRLLDKARHYVSELEAFLDHARREKMNAKLEFFLRNAIISADERQLGIIQAEHSQPDTQAISAAARFKQARLSMDVSGPKVTTPAPTPATLTSPPLALPLQELHIKSEASRESMRLRMSLLKLDGSARSHSLRTLAQYDQRTVLLEWKNIVNEEKMTIAGRVNEVATLLHSAGPALHSLQCRGFVKDALDNRYGYVFALPDELDTTLSNAQNTTKDQDPSLEMVTRLDTLQEVLGEHSEPSLNVRLDFAVRILDNLLNLHTAGWLHKELRSDNILLIRKDNATSMPQEVDLSTSAIYVAGYTHSRMDKPDETTEPLQAEFEADLYRHPLLLSDVRRPYRKNFDIFSVGCILLEIGMWAPLRRILEDHAIAQSEVPHKGAPEWESKVKLDSAHRSDRGREHGRDKSPGCGSKCNTDLSAIKEKLLCLSPLPSGHAERKGSATSEKSRDTIVDCLEITMGHRYASIVRDLLTGADLDEHSSSQEHESALDLEMRARATVLAVAQAL